MENLNAIGLDRGKAKELADTLNELLANYSVFYQNVRGYHWNIKGDKFFELHIKYEQLYNSLWQKIDDIAERILTLGHTPEHNYSEYLRVSRIKQSSNISDSLNTAEEVLDSLQTLIDLQRKIHKLSANAGDEGTNAIIIDYIKEQEKLVWMYSAYLKQGEPELVQ